MLIAESLRPGTVLDVLTVHKVDRIAVDNPAPSQPEVWTFLTFTSETEAEQLAAQLAAALLDGPWYVDLRSPEETFIAFAGGTWTSYHRGDAGGRARAIDMAAALGIPETQLDWVD